MKKKAIVLGSTGSIGKSTLEVLAHLSDEWEVVGLAAGHRSSELAEQANRFRPGAIAIADAEHAGALDASLAYSPTIHAGDNALVDLVTEVGCDCVVCAVVGASGLAATLRCVELGRRIALANKEALVIAGSLIMPLAKKTGSVIVPVDSEHSAVFQALRAGRPSEVRRIYLTASGGPFQSWDERALDDITPEEAMRHPTWTMGPKVTIDSATMMNKALEIVEARWLFGLSSEKIEVIVHPEAIIHSLVEFCDGSLIAQLGTPDMRTPIQYALTYPARRPGVSERLDLSSLRQLTLKPPDVGRFPAIRLGHEVARMGGTAGAVLNAANEAAVELFRARAIGFRDVAQLTELAIKQHKFQPDPSLDDLLAADDWARKEVSRCVAC